MVVFELEEQDPFIHLAKDVKVEKGVRRTIVRCGKHLIDDPGIAPYETTVWESGVTCTGCRRTDDL